MLSQSKSRSLREEMENRRKVEKGDGKMRKRFLALMGTLAVLMVVGSLVAAGQGPAATETFTPARTPDGQPDLQGIWSFATITPLQRRSEFGDKEVLTDEEKAALEEQAVQNQFVDRELRPRDTGTYNQLWFDRGTTVVATGRTSIIVDPPTGMLPDLTPEAQKLADARVEDRRLNEFKQPELRDAKGRCIVHGVAGPPMVSGAYNNNMELLQSPGYVVILNEQIHDARIIPLDGRPPIPQDIRQWMGDSRGHWEGNTLVVDTTNFIYAYFPLNDPRAGLPGETYHLVERFTRISPDQLKYEFTVNDPKTYARPWSGESIMTRTDLPMYEYACHEGNYSLQAILGGEYLKKN